ncbi:unnamed protein product, partial [Prorocentrum cordatum]
DTGAFPPWQHLLSGKELTQDGASMGDTIATIAARSKLERVAAYRQLQGTPRQLCLLSGRTLDELDLPGAANVRPTDQTESRMVVPDVASGTGTAYVVGRMSGERLAILPADCAKATLLTLMLDQGSIGATGAALSIFHQGKMIHARFDKIHRVIRDLKNAEKQCMDSLFMVCKMWSAYLYGMDNRKYLHHIAKYGNMPCDSIAETQAIFDNVLQMESFKNKMSQPKQANWFAWNKAAHEQIPEFWATKMVLESQLDD